MIKAIQFIDEFNKKEDADGALKFILEQDGIITGRLLKPSIKSSKWRVQAFFIDETINDWLPDGCKKVMLPLKFYDYA